MLKKIIKVVLALLLILAIVFFVYGPRYLDRISNKVITTSSFPKNSWYDSIPFIADLHCDQLLWDRNLLEQVDYGHVDLPRMQQANMAFQAFTIVSKVPSGMNI